MKREFIYGLIVGTIITILIIASMEYSRQTRPNLPSIESVKNSGCRYYLTQNTPCSDSNINITYQGKVYTLDNFLKTYYKCTDENCLRNLCGCPGY
jgi:hypothetical protein